MILTAIIIIVLWAKWSGKTPGKAAMGIRIVKMNGENIDWKTSIIRYFGYFLSILTLFIGFLMVGFRKDKRGLHDLVAGTKVIHIH